MTTTTTKTTTTTTTTTTLTTPICYSIMLYNDILRDTFMLSNFLNVVKMKKKMSHYIFSSYCSKINTDNVLIIKCVARNLLSHGTYPHLKNRRKKNGRKKENFYTTKTTMTKKVKMFSYKKKVFKHYISF